MLSNQHRGQGFRYQGQVQLGPESLCCFHDQAELEPRQETGTFRVKKAMGPGQARGLAAVGHGPGVKQHGLQVWVLTTH